MKTPAELETLRVNPLHFLPNPWSIGSATRRNPLVPNTLILSLGFIDQNTLALAVASTSIVPPNARGALSGLYNTVESLGRFIGPAGFATTYAWSVSSSSYHWVGYQFVFYTSAALSGGVAMLAWRTFTHETLTQPARMLRPACKHGAASTAAATAATTATSASEKTALLVV